MGNQEEYTGAIEGLDQCGNILCNLIEELLLDKGIQILRVSHRVKSFDMTLKKMKSQPQKYDGMNDITDLLGIRIITYFPNDVDKVAEVLRREFKIDSMNSVDKRKSLDPDKFGYLSLHYVAALTARRRKLIEYKRFSDVRFEIQIRSILQHAWAEIEHDLGYKIEGALPVEMRRGFSRLAGLLELADDEFERLRSDLSAYETKVRETIKTEPGNLKIDQSTIIAALTSEKSLIDLDRMVVYAANSSLDKRIDNDYVGGEARDLKILGIRDIKGLLKLVELYKKYVERFAYHWFKDDTQPEFHTSLPKSIGLFYLGYVLAVQSHIAGKDLSDWRADLIKDNPNLLLEMEEAWSKVITELGEPKPWFIYLK